MNILYITYGLPAPPSSGARIRDFNLITRISRHHRVSVLSLLEFPEERDHMPALRAHCEHVDGVLAGRSLAGTGATALGGLLRGRPVATAPFYYPELAGRIRRLVQEQHFDLVQIEHSFLAAYRSALPRQFSGATVLSFHNIGVHQYRSMLDMSTGMARLPAALKWLSLRGWEAKAAGRFDHAIVVSEADRERLLALGASDRIAMIENGVDCTALQPLADPPEGPGEIVFIGTMGYLPNRDAARYFCREILPLIHAERPGCRLTIVGSGGLEHLSDLAQPGLIDVSGRVDDPVPFYQRAHLAVVPLRSGGGSRLKILEAMALGRPVVSSSLGREGLDLEDGREVLTADEPATFARQALVLLADKERWRSVADAARRKAESRYDWNLAADRLLDLYRQLHGEPALPPQRSSDHDGSGSPRLSVIIPVFNARDSLPLCLDALARSNQRDFELIIVDDHSTDGSAEIARARCRRFIRLDRNRGASTARNRGARMASANLLFFLDADVLVEPDTLDNILGVFEQNPGISATFCSYQHDTIPRNFVSQFKNLQHHYTHQVSGREAVTFCGGFGAIYRQIFLELDGFNEGRRAMEDVELGYRLHKAGHRILLSPQIQLTHTKHYTLPRLVHSDVMQRAVPWTKVMLERRVFRSDLNLRPNNLASMAVVCLMLITPFLPLPVLPAESVLALVFVVLNRHFLVFLQRMRGTLFALRAVPMTWLQYCYSGVGLALGTLSYLKDRVAKNKPSGAGQKEKLLVVAINLNPPGGGQCVGAWALQALCKDWDITILCADRPRFADLNSHFGTRLDAGDFTILQVPWPIRHIHRIDPDPSSFQRASWLMRMSRRTGHDFDLTMAFDNEMDFGRPGIQYIHYPYLFRHKDEVDAVRKTTRLGRVRKFFQGRYRPWMITSGLTFEGVESNLMLVNSQWTARVVARHYHNEPLVLYPPVKWSRESTAWDQPGMAFASVGRIEPVKRQIEAIDILERVRERGYRVSLDIIGDVADPRYARELHDRARAAGSWVRTHHGISRDELEEIVSGCRYGLHTMLNEHFGIAVAELARAGCLVFVPDDGGQVEIVGGEADLIYGSDDEAVEKICAVLQNEEKQERLRESLAAHAAQFTEERFMNHLRAIAGEFVRGRQP